MSVGFVPSPRPAPRERSPRAREIIDVARTLLEAVGREGLTMRRLGDELGIRAPSLYKHLEGRAGLEVALAETALDEIGLALRAAVGRSTDEPVHAVLGAYRAAGLASPELYRLVTASTFPRARLLPGLEAWAGESFFLAVGEPYLAQALWSFAHGTLLLELDQRFLDGSNPDRAWQAGAEVFGAARLARLGSPTAGLRTGQGRPGDCHGLSTPSRTLGFPPRPELDRLSPGPLAEGSEERTGRRARTGRRRAGSALGERPLRVASRSVPATSRLELLRSQLDNGLTVLVAPDHASPLVGVAVVYDVGFRSEHVGKAEHPRLVQSAGGVMNGHTRPDLTAYYQVVPAPALELTLWLEADRMARLALTQENLDNQVAVVKEEIRVNVLNQPFGGFPWIPLPALAFDTFPNAHNGYGDFADLEHATLDDAAEFYRSYYTPANAVLVVAGDCEPEAALALVERHFAGIVGGPRPTRPSFAEPRHTELRRRALPDPLAPTPALAAGYRVPDPVAELEPYLASVVLADLLADGDASRLRERLVHREAVVTDLGCQVGLLGDAFSARDPVLFQVILFHPGRRTADELLHAVGEELERLATEGPTGAELARVGAQDAGRHWREVDQLLNRTLSIADSEAIHGKPELAAALPGLVAAVTPDQVSRAARDLLDQQPALLEVVPSPEGPRQ